MSVHSSPTSVSRIPGAPATPVSVAARTSAILPPAPTAGPTPFFFGAARRSGTTWLASMLNSHQEIECRNEGWVFNELGCSFPAWIDEPRVRAWAARREARGTWLRDQSIDDALRAMRRAAWSTLTLRAVELEGWKDPKRLKYLGEKTTTFLCTQIDDIHATFPDARFLHMLRDGRDVVVSDAFLAFRELEDREMPADAKREAAAARDYHIFGRGKPLPLIGPAMLRHLVNDWARCVAGARTARELFAPGGQFHEVRYERLTEDPHAELAAIFHWLGVDSDPALVEQLVLGSTFEKLSGGRPRGQGDNTAEWRKGVSGDWRTYFTNDTKAQFKAMAGELLVELGYEPDTNW